MSFPILLPVVSRDPVLARFRERLALHRQELSAYRWELRRMRVAGWVSPTEETQLRLTFRHLQDGFEALLEESQALGVGHRQVP